MILNSTSTLSEEITNEAEGQSEDKPIQMPLLIISTLSAALLVCTVVMVIVCICLLASLTSKRRLQKDLFQLHDATDPIYEDIEVNTKKNVAYRTTFT